MKGERMKMDIAANQRAAHGFDCVQLTPTISGRQAA
jgi:hypothetical protein